MEKNSIFILFLLVKFCIEKMFHNIICIHQSIWWCCCCGLHSSFVCVCVRVCVCAHVFEAVVWINNSNACHIQYMFYVRKWVIFFCRCRDRHIISAQHWMVRALRMLAIWHMFFSTGKNQILRTMKCYCKSIRTTFVFITYSTWARTRAFKVSKDYLKRGANKKTNKQQ